MKRREFVKLCASAVAGVNTSPELLAEGNRELHFYERVALIDNHTKQAVRASTPWLPMNSETISLSDEYSGLG